MSFRENRGFCFLPGLDYFLTRMQSQVRGLLPISSPSKTWLWLIEALLSLCEIRRCMNGKTNARLACVTPSSGGKTRQRGEIENVNVWLMAEEECCRYNTKSIKDNFRAKTLETRALNHEVIHSDWSRSVVITWECYMWLQGWLAELSRDSKLDLMGLRWCTRKSFQKVQIESSKHFTSI